MRRSALLLGPVGLLLVLGATTTAAAQAPASSRPIRIGIGGGVSVPTGDYVTAGLGALNFKVDGGDGETKFAINGGAGLAMRLFGADAFIEARVANVYTDEGFIDTKGIQYVPVTFGIVF